ncbi:unnamed protein product [Chondrus crispus]|uniref:Uncharacterized protein n=1 Tax=Chondrus crispus TaxID=2769 RepID=R7QJP5_CHOCR|nr:unnamed protein product [Chondrus crispus]CDF37958.1 unnamed protein product [Chondrus crispus]|eukprot:XP_005717827.1 unnamed protein product [Chondrus crispus]
MALPLYVHKGEVMECYIIAILCNGRRTSVRGCRSSSSKSLERSGSDCSGVEGGRPMYVGPPEFVSMAALW